MRARMNGVMIEITDMTTRGNGDGAVHEDLRVAAGDRHRLPERLFHDAAEHERGTSGAIGMSSFVEDVAHDPEEQDEVGPSCCR